MRGIFLSIRSDNPELVVRGRLLKGAAIIALAALGALPLALLGMTADYPLMGPALALDLVMCSLSFWLAHRGSITFGGIVFCLALVVVNVLTSWTGADNDILVGLTTYVQLVPIMVSGMVIGSRAIPFFGALPLVAFTLASTQGQNSESRSAFPDANRRPHRYFVCRHDLYRMAD